MTRPKLTPAKAEAVARRMRCPACGAVGKFCATSTSVYGTDFGPIYVCSNPTCDTRVGAHRHTLQPKGTLAGGRLRDLRKRCHDLFDTTWRDGGIPRSDAYALLAKAMQMKPKAAHIAMFTEAECAKLIAILTGEST